MGQAWPASKSPRGGSVGKSRPELGPRSASLTQTETKTLNVDQAEHQSFEILVPPLGSDSSKPTRFIVSPPNLKKDVAQYRRLTKVLIGTPG